MLDNLEYRICYKTVDGRMNFAIYEIILDNMQNLIYISDEPSYPSGSTIEEFSFEMSKYADALRKPILEYKRLKSRAVENITVLSKLHNEDEFIN